MTVWVGFQKSLIYLLITDFDNNIWTGGCNGCLNVDNPSNGGLSDLVEQLETLYQDEGYSSLISRSNFLCYHILLIRADFWALAGIAAVDTAIENANEDCDSDDCAVPDSGLVFQWGRQVCDNNLSIELVHSTFISHAPIRRTVPLHLTPLTMWDYQGVRLTMTGLWTSLPLVRERQSYHKKSVFRLRLSIARYIPWCDQTQPTLLYIVFFATEFGFDENQTVALMGAHTLGQVSKHEFYEGNNTWIELQMNAENSGHSGVWTVGEANDFNNQYFKVHLEWLSDYKA